MNAENDDKDLENISDEDFINNLLNEVDEDAETNDESKKAKEKELTEEEQKRKNKDAEEARKRREAEEKAKKEADEKVKTPTEQDKTTASEKQKTENEEKLGRELIEFKKKYPDIEFSELDKDGDFKTYIDGKLLRGKTFLDIYEEYTSFVSKYSGKTPDDITKQYLKKQVGVPPSPTNNGEAEDVYSEIELENLAKKMTTMSPSQVKKIEAKFNKSLRYYENKK